MILETDRREIEDTLFRYATAIDETKWELLGEVFLPNARVDYTGANGPVLCGADVADWLRKKMAPFARLQHFVSNIRLTPEGAEICARAYVLAIHGYKGSEGAMRFFQLGGEYEDRFVRTAAGWRISERILRAGWFDGDVPTA